MIDPCAVGEDDDIGRRARRVAGCFAYRQNFVMRVVQRRPDKVVHCRIDNDKRPGRALLDPNHTRHQNPGITGDQPSRFEKNLTVQVADDVLDHVAVFHGTRRLPVNVGNAETTAQVQVFDPVTAGPQCPDQSPDHSIGPATRVRV